MAVTPVFGLTGTGRWTTTERPTNWRQTLLYRKPRGKLPLTALMSKAGRDTTTSAEFHWHEEDFAQQSGPIAGIYTDEAMTSACTTIAAGATIYIKALTTGDSPLSAYVIPGSLMQVCSQTDSRAAMVVEVISVDRAFDATNARIKVYTKTLFGYTQVTTVSGVAKAIGDAATYAVTGTATAIAANWGIVLPTLFPEFGGVPKVITYKPGSFYNYTSIKKEAIALSRTAMAEKGIRPNDKDTGYMKMKAKALEALGIKMEMELLYGTRFEETDSLTGQLKRGTMGLLELIQSTSVPAANKSGFRHNVTYIGDTWVESGYTFLKNFFLNFANYADLESQWNVVGRGAILGLTALAETNRFITMAQTDAEYGMAVHILRTPWGNLNLIDHPLFNINPNLQYAWLGIPAEGITNCFVEGGDVDFLEDQNFGKGGLQHVDGRFDLYLAENGYQYNDLRGFMMLNDIGRNGASVD